MKIRIISFVLSRWRILLYAFVCILCALLVTSYSQDIGLRVFDFIAANQERKLVSYLDQEKVYISQSVTNFAKNPELQAAIAEENADVVTSLFDKEKNISGLTAYTAAEDNGLALSRSPIKANLGDNVFLTSSIGRQVLNGITEAQYGAGRNFSLTLGAGALMRDSGGTLYGAVFGGYWLDNNYARSFKEKYLNDFRKREIIFYSKDEGVTGDSIDDLDTRNKLRTYLSHASTLIQDGRSGDLLNINGKDYVITNRLLTGEDEVYGGAILLTPLPLTLFLRSMILSGLIAIIFFVSLLLIEKVTVPQLLRFKKRSLYILLVSLSFVVFISVWVGVYTYGKLTTMNLEKPKFTIYNSTMKVRPGSGVYTVGYQQQLAIVIYSGGERINAVEAELRFDPHVISVDSISFNRSICTPETIIERQIDNVGGSVKISCSVVEKVFSDVRGIVADLNVTPLKPGNAALTFGEETHVLAADGLATDVLRSATSGFYRVFDEGDLVNSFSKKTILIPYSRTHENSSTWYSNKKIILNWQKIEGAQYEYELTKDATSTILYPKITSATEASLVVPDDGVYYFKLAPKRGDVIGLVSILKIQIDTTAPDLPFIKASSLNVKKDDIVRFELSSGDDGSGLQKNFYVRVDGSAWLPTFSRLYMPFHDKGNHTVDVRVFDNAENYSDSRVTVQVKN